MARIISSTSHDRYSGGLHRELDVLERLQLGLPDAFELFHRVAVREVSAGHAQQGEVDVAVLAPWGGILLIEVKAGALNVAEGRLFKSYQSRVRDVAGQIQRQTQLMRQRLRSAGLQAPVDGCLVVPDFRIAGEVAALDRDHILDAQDHDRLGQAVLTLLAQLQLSTPEASPSAHGLLHDFLAGCFQLVPDLNALGQQQQRATRQLAEGLATWVPRIHAPGGVFVINASAGSGKTQLALRLLSDAARDGRHARYVCFNRPLADAVAAHAPPAAQVASFHELCAEHWQRTIGAPPFDRSDGFEQMASRYLADAPARPATTDCLIIDEGQDFEPAWVDALAQGLRPDGRLYLLKDERQRLYAREAFALPEAVEVCCHDNFRSPAAVVDSINLLGLADVPLVARNPYVGEPPATYGYHDADTLVATTATAVAALMSDGFAVGQIAVLTGRGHARSQILSRDRLGDHATRRFLGRFTDNQDPVWSDGALLVESIYRFKGQSIDAVVLTELDFAQLDDRARAMLFVGLTRAHLAVAMVLSAEAERALSQVLT